VVQKLKEFHDNQARGGKGGNMNQVLDEKQFEPIQ
jgi:hypothetical protein